MYEIDFVREFIIQDHFLGGIDYLRYIVSIRFLYITILSNYILIK